jgi:ElaA protein
MRGHSVTRPKTVALRRSWAKDLDAATLYDLLKLRVEVFVVEQECPHPELDGRDVLGEKSVRIGRVCTKRSMRGRGHTTRLLCAALAEVGDYPCRINAQTYLTDMYRQHGFIPDGDEFLDDGVPHVPMLRAGSHTGGQP